MFLTSLYFLYLTSAAKFRVCWFKPITGLTYQNKSTIKAQFFFWHRHKEFIPLRKSTSDALCSQCESAHFNCLTMSGFSSAGALEVNGGSFFGRSAHFTQLETHLLIFTVIKSTWKSDKKTIRKRDLIPCGNYALTYEWYQSFPVLSF